MPSNTTRMAESSTTRPPEEKAQSALASRRLYAGFTQVEGDHDPQVVEPRGTAGEHDGAT